jgi:L-fuconolactonase
VNRPVDAHRVDAHRVDAPRVDAHLHLWDLSAGGYAWLTPDLGPLHRSFTPEQARTELDACGIASAVLVQAEDSARDTAAMLAIADAHPWVVGVVGWVDLEQPERAEQQLDRWQQHPAFCGVRTLVHDDPRDGVLAMPAVRQTLTVLAERALPFDVPDAWPRHLSDVADLAAALPDLRIVVDHLAKPPVDREQWDDWRRTLAAVAAHPGTTAKVSGLQVPGHPFDTTHVRPAWETALALFGPARLMWGSDWPMTELSAGYAGTWQVLSGLVAELSADEQAALLGGTAEQVYGVRSAA